ncbi:SGNH/GDSL hydrolase family protein [Cohnella hashimotonis]|uniref:SGNH/GDSL hydrolase family protein n=1 Tax=Cohnella hashimotonis TaxID=2826895 RepID=A0ABT6TDU4_9BACL|nr:SGNH/GDSL hydrolase family protein [Cohnella hashimotonis]MDI4644761.1 SGNH/GDSL hydrolase family protein [Cohnella hashimotonis]
MNAQVSGLSVVSTAPASMAVIVQPGFLTIADRVVEVPAETKLPIRPAGQRQYLDQVYTIRGVGTASPSWWNGEDIRGSGGVPYQRMVPGTLAVYSSDRGTKYAPDADYAYDYHWGTVKRMSGGRIAEGETLSLDYAVWLCRYDAIALREDGSLTVVEGDVDAPDSRELLLPEPPRVKDGFVLAHIFTGWGQSCVYGGESAVSSMSTSSPPVTLRGRYEDIVRRTYYIEIEPNPGGSPLIRMGASGEDYGTGLTLTRESLRWTTARTFEWDEELPLVMETAYGFEVDWGLGLAFPLPSRGDVDAPLRFVIEAIPEMILDCRPVLAGTTPASTIPLEQTGHLADFRRAIAEGRPLRIAFFGESATRSGLWPYQVMEGLRARYPDARLFSSNVAVGGEQSVMGIHRLEKEVLAVAPDLVVLEYMINDACSGHAEAHIERTVRAIVERVLEYGAACMIVMANGVNPLFTKHGAKRNIRRYYALYRRLASEYGVAFVGGFEYFDNLHRFGKYFVTELKGNMVNHAFGNEDTGWGPFDRVLGEAMLDALG